MGGCLCTMEIHPDLIFLGVTNARNSRRRFGIKTADREHHMHLLGRTGMGKSALLTSMFVQDMYRGNGCCFLDPHGQHAREILDLVPPQRAHDTVYLDAADFAHPFGFNVFGKTVEMSPQHRALYGINLTTTFRKIFDQGSWLDRTEHYFRKRRPGADGNTPAAHS